MHEQFSGEDVRQLREAHPGAIVLAHPECPPDVLARSRLCRLDVRAFELCQRTSPSKVVLLTECSMSDNVAADNPGRELRPAVQPLPAHEAHHAGEYLRRLVTMQHEVTIPEDVRVRAKAAIDAMLALPKMARPLAFKTGQVPLELEMVI